MARAAEPEPVLAFVAVLAFLLGRQGAMPVTQPPVEPGAPALAATELDTQRLLTASVSDHLEQMNIVLTEFANGPESPNFGAERATDLLVSNRLYRQAAAARAVELARSTPNVRRVVSRLTVTP